MKKIMIFAAMAAMFSLVSCQKDEVVANNESKVSPVFTASINAGTTKTTVDVSTGKVTWESTDKITITDASAVSAIYKIKSIDGNTGKATFELESGALGDGPYTATYGSAPSTYQTYSATAGKLYMTAPATSNNSFTFTVQCGLMKLNLSKPGETITDIAVTGTPTGGTKKTYTMYCPGGVDISSGKDFFIALPAGSYDKIEVYKYGATNGFEVCSLIPSTSIAVSANHIKPVKASDGKIIFSECQNLPGVFSVSKDNGTTIKQIRFSQGNLTCDISGATPDWKFYEHQYDCASAYDPNLISLFTWGYNATKSIDPDGTEYVTGHTTDGESFDPAEDWGTQIGDGSTWRTLTTAEWQYLFNTRSNASSLYKCGVTVCGKTNCVVLLPDDWAWDTNTVGADWQTGGYPMTQTDTEVTWEKMEKAGAVCLPAAGYRSGSSVSHVGSGFYWSSSSKSDNRAYFVYVTTSSLSLPTTAGARKDSYSVRLITESN